MKLLLIESSEIERDIFRLALERLQSTAELFKAKDCEAAVEAMTSSKIPTPDHIILDIDAASDPGSCLEMLRSAPAAVLSKITLYSASTDTARIKSLIRQGAHSHIFKSYSFAIFCADVSCLLAGQ